MGNATGYNDISNNIPVKDQLRSVKDQLETVHV